MPIVRKFCLLLQISNPTPTGDFVEGRGYNFILYIKTIKSMKKIEKILFLIKHIFYYEGIF